MKLISNCRDAANGFIDNVREIMRDFSPGKSSLMTSVVNKISKMNIFRQDEVEFRKGGEPLEI